jgi:hypothetical protein
VGKAHADHELAQLQRRRYPQHASRLIHAPRDHQLGPGEHVELAHEASAPWVAKTTSPPPSRWTTETEPSRMTMKS